MEDAKMTDVPENVEAIARQSWGMAQRVGMKIAAMPLDQREAAFVTAERSLHDTALEMGMAGERMDGFIKIQMEAIRGMVQNIDVGGSPQGGNA
jgi:hypothetical protein